MLKNTPNTAADFWKMVDRTDPDGCWPFLGKLNNQGYGSMNVAGVKDLAHRHAFRLANGPIPKGEYVLHHCNNKPCARPDHLYSGTQRQNLRDAVADGLVRVGSQHEKAKMTEATVIEARRLRAEGESGYSLAKKFAISRPVMHRILTRQSWKHV